MSFEAPISRLRTKVISDWTDYNGHMNVAYYTLIFNLATDVFYPLVGLGEPYKEKTGNSTFALEAHTCYQREGSLGDVVEVTTQLLGFDEKRLHFFNTMRHAEEGYQMATIELLSIHVDLSKPKVIPLPDEPMRLLAGMMESHGELPIPPEVGSVMKVGPKNG